MDSLDLKGYKTADLKKVADIDCFSVRDEAYARQERLIKQIEAAKAKIAKMLAEVDECGKAIEAARYFRDRLEAA